MKLPHYPMGRLSCRLLAVVALLGLGARVASAVPAFPGAEGFGLTTSGARGGTVYHVTTLADSGAGSFRDAVSVSGRTVVFDVGGIITLTSPVVLKSNLTIAGQTAPGEGITLYGDRLGLSGVSNLIMRYLRVREGINGDAGTDTMSAASGDRMIFDHLSVSWGRDETFSFNGTASNITIQDCLIGQGLLAHSAGGLIQTGGGVSIFRCLYTDNYMRNPKVKGVNDFQNNVVYNWGSGGGYIPAGDSAGLTYANLIGNYFVAGPTTAAAGEGPFKTGNLNYNLYHSGNLQDLNVDGVLNGTAVTDASFPTLKLVATQFPYAAPATLLTATQAFAHVSARAGASLKRDYADTYMLAELASIGTSGAHIFSEADIGGIGTVAGGLAPVDTDGDGMPDWWESAAGTNPLVADNNGDLDGDGYTNLENYLNALAPAGVPAATIDGVTSDTGSSSSDGITSDGSLILRGTAAAGSVVTLARVDTGVIGTATADGSGNWTFDYTGTPLADRYYAFIATVDLGGGKISPPTRAFVVKVDTAAAAAPTITSIVLTPSVTITGTSEPGSSVSVTLSGVGIVATATTDVLGNWTAPYVGASLAPGAYSFTAAAVDLAGNPGPASVPYLVDTSLAAPVFTSITTDTGSSTTDRLTNDTTLILNGTSFANATISVTRVGFGVIGTATANASGVWAFDYTATVLPAGQHTFTATASNGGNSSAASVAFVITIDTTRPTITSIRRQNPTTTSTTGSTLVYRVTFSETVSGVDATDFSLTLSGTTATLSSLVAVSSTVYDITVISAAGDGTVRVDLKTTGTGIADVAGNAISGGYTAGQTFTLRLPGSGVWISTESGELWSQSTDWEAGAIATGSGATADFSSINIDGPITVQLDTPRTLGRVVFGDTDFTVPARWILSNNDSPANTLTLAGSSPNIVVNALTTTGGDTADVPAANASPSTLDVALDGTAGFTKTGVGTLLLTKPNPITGPLTITKGIVEVGTGGSLTPSSVVVGTSQQLRVSGGTFNTPGNVTWNSGTGTGIIVSGGVANFQKIIPSNARNSFVKVTGGTVTATDISFLRSGDSRLQAIAAGIFISGGDTTVGTMGLGTGDSWGSLGVSGGRLTVTGPLNVAYQKTGGRGAVVSMSGGELNSTDASPTGGFIMSRNPGGTNANTNNVSEFIITGGVSNIARLTLGFDATSSAGSATVTVTTGELNLGSGGIVKNGTAGLASSITLNSGTLGALAAWSTTHPIFLAGTPATLALRGANSTGAPFDFSLGGALTGAGGFAKTGAGSLTLGAANTFTGDVAINAGTLIVNGSIAPGGAFDLNSSGTLAGTGTVNRALALNSGGTLAPAGLSAAGTLTATSATWNGGSQLALNLGTASDKLVLTGALTKGSAGTFTIAVTPGSGFTTSATYTLATFASTTFTAADFTVTGLGSMNGAVVVNATSLQLVVTSPFDLWAASLPAGQRGPADDPDGDGLPNGLEFVLGQNALAATGVEPVATTVTVGPDTYPAIAFIRRHDLGGATCDVRVSASLDFTGTLGSVEVSALARGDGTDDVIVRSAVPLSVTPRQFFRITATLP